MTDLGNALDQLTASFSAHCVLPPLAAETCALWCAFTWAHEEAQTSPILLISSPEKRCGKTTLLRVVEHFVRRPLAASSVTPAAVFRTIEMEMRTLLMDEADTYVHRSEDWRSIINGGHTRDAAKVLRCDGKLYMPKEFSTWAPKVLSMIGKPPETILDRSIVIRLERKRVGETVKKLRRQDRARLHQLRDKLEQAIKPHLVALRDAVPFLPAALNDRAGDSWEPLLAIADLADGHWPQTARRAASLISGDSVDDDSEGVELLSNIREVLGELTEDRIFSTDLVEALSGRKDWRWSRYVDGHALSEKQLAVRLSVFDIHSKYILIGPEVKRGYLVEIFDEVFDRYLPPSTAGTATSLQRPEGSTPVERDLEADSPNSPEDAQLRIPDFLKLKVA